MYAMILIIALAAAPSVAPEVMSKLEPAFSGTLVSTYDDGGRKNDPSSGVWNVKGNTICLHQRRPIPIGSYCTPLPNGTSWRTKAASGEMVTVRLVSGRG